MNCTEYAEYLKKYETGEADISDQIQMRNHELDCPECTKMRQLAETVQNGLERYRKETPQIPEDLHRKWVTRLQSERKTKSKSGFRHLAAVAAGLIILFLLFGGREIPQRLNKTSGSAPMVEVASESMAYAPEYEEYASYASDMGAAEMAVESAGGGSPRLNSLPAVVDDTRKIVRTVSIEIRTAEFDKSLNQIHQMCTESGGWISSSSVVSKTGGMTASLTLRIPSEKLNAFLDGTGDLGRIIRQDESAEDRTDSYKDTQSRLNTQKMLLERLQSLVTTSEKLEDLLALEKQIAEIQYNIDSLTSSLKSTDQQVNYSRVDISLKEEKKKEVVETREVTFGERLSAAIELGFASFAETIQNMILVLAAMIPYLIALICILIIVMLLIRRIRKKK